MCFKDIAPKYFEKDLDVVPITPGTKYPFIDGWQTKDFSTDEMLNKYRSYGIGIRFSKKSKLIAVDIDIEHEFGKKEISKIMDNYKTQVSRIGNRKRLPTLFYRKTDEIISSKEDGIEVFSSSGQVVLPPTSHPEFNNVRYEWTTQYDLTNFDIDDLPPFPGMSVIRKIREIGHKYPNDPKAPTKSFNSLKKTRTGKYREGSHNKLSRPLMAMINNGVMTREEIIESLLEIDRVFSNGVISYFESDWREEFKGCLDKMKNVNTFIDDAIKAEKKRGKDIILPENEISIDLSSMLKNEEDIKVENFKPITGKKKERASYPHAKDGTFLDLCIKNIIENSPKPKIKFAYFSSILTVGHILANHIEFNEFTSNLMSCLVDTSGGGKNEPLKYPKNLLVDSGLTDTVGVDEIGSSSFILDDLTYNRKRLYTIDEVSSLFSGMGQEGSYNENTGTTLSKLYSASLSEFSGKGVKGAGTYGMCHSPAISLMSGTTYTELRKTFKIENFGQGIGSRILFCFDEQKPIHRRISKRVICDDLKDFARYYSLPFLPDTEHRRILKKDYKPKKNEQPNEDDMYLIINKPRPKKISISKEIDEAINSFFDQMSEVNDKEENEIVKPILNRWYDIFSKVFIVSVYGNRSVLNWDTVPTMDDFNFAKEFVLAYLDDCRIYLAKSIRHSKWVEEEEELMDIIKAAYKKKGTPLSKKDIKSTKFTGKYIESILVSLTLSEKIIYEPSKRGVKCSIVPCEID